MSHQLNTVFPHLRFFFLLTFSFLHPPVAHSSNSQNLETFYPYFTPPPPATPGAAVFPPSTPQTAARFPVRHTNKKLVAKVVAATGVTTLVCSALLFLFVQRYVKSRRGKTQEDVRNSARDISPLAAASDRFSRLGSRVKGLIINENGMDVVYWKGGGDTGEILSPENGALTRKWSSLKKKNESVQATPLLRGKSSSSHVIVSEQEHQRSSASSSSDHSKLSTFSFPVVRDGAQPIAPLFSTPSPPPAPPVPLKKLNVVPPPPMQLRIDNPEKKGKQAANKKENDSQVKLKPLHWDKINKNNDHSMVWDKLDSGSFRFDNGLMEALFGYVATNRSSPIGDGNSNRKITSEQSGQIMILDPRKSQNIAIVIKSLPVSMAEILDSLTNGASLDAEILEKLGRIAPTKEEQSQIMDFNGDLTKLADAESFLYELLKRAPSAFSRFNAMHFRANYATEVRQVKESFGILETACRELRNRGLFMKLLEAVLKAGNKMNAGTSRGNAQAFKLTSLKKLSDVKSTDGKTTLLHFVVEEVVRFEGRKLFSSRGRNGTQSADASETSLSKDEREKEYKVLGLPIVASLSSEFSYVKMAAKIDIETLSTTLSSLEARLREVKFLISRSSATSGGDRFLNEIKHFFEAARDEIDDLRREEKRVTNTITRTTEYYHSGASNDSKFTQIQLFTIVTDFLGMVDKTCIEISRKLQKMNASGQADSRLSPISNSSKKTLRFPNLPAHFLDDNSSSTSDESD